jgi:hypothetical protein
MSIIRDKDRVMTRQRKSDLLFQSLGIAVAWIVALAMTTCAR